MESLHAHESKKARTAEFAGRNDAGGISITNLSLRSYKVALVNTLILRNNFTRETTRHLAHKSRDAPFLPLDQPLNSKPSPYHVNRHRCVFRLGPRVQMMARYL